MSILITGGLGYLGARIVKAFAQKYPDRKIIYTHHQHITTNYFSEYKNVSYRKLRLSEYTDFNTLCSGIKTIIHLAFPNEIVCKQNVEMAIDSGIRGTYYLLSEAKRHKVSNFIFVSTAHVYGSPLEGEITEKTLPQPVHPYAISKRAAEDFVLSFRKEYDFNAVVIRLSNGFGYPIHKDINRWSLLVNDLCRQAVLNKKMELSSSGLQYRDFIPFDDIIDAIFLLDKLNKNETLDGLFNLGSGKSVTVFEFAKQIAVCAEKVLGYNVPLFRKEPQPNEMPKKLIYNCNKISSIGYKPKGNVNFEIEETLRFCKAFLNSNG
ncbi:MAG: NAD-dependent epimerase/dehydratase family protein [Bacteroidia bacterium]